MRKHFSKFSQKYFYSAETHNILNLLTLDIKDKEIAREYELYRIKRFNDLFWPLVGVFALFNTFGWLSYFLNNGELASAVRPAHQWVAVIFMMIPRYCCNRYSPQSWILCMSVSLVLV